MQYVTAADGVQLYVKDWGSGPPVVLIHGWPLSSDSWDDHAMALAASGYRTIAYDRRGFGRSTQPWRGFEYDTLADDLAAVIEQTGVRDATLVGFSMGGGEVVRYLTRHAGRSVAKAALISSVVPYLLKAEDNPDGVDQQVFEGMSQALNQDRPKFLAGFLREVFGVTLMSHGVSQETLEWARAAALQGSLRATLECVKAFSGTDFRPELAAVRVPTLLIHGTSDKIVPIDAAARPAHRALGNSTLIEYDGAPHGLLATEKQRLTQDLLDFLRH